MSRQDADRRYWRSLEELGDTPEFREALQREFLEEPTAEGIDGTTRRHFLGLMGASLAMSGLAGCVRRPKEHILPYAKAPEDLLPGVPQFYATATSLGGRAIGLVAESHEGRPTKLEGNPDHPASGGGIEGLEPGDPRRVGGLTMQHQAMVLDLYDPARLRKPLKDGQPTTWAETDDFLRRHFEALTATSGEGVYVLTAALPSPTLAALRQQFQSRYPRARWLVYEPVSEDNQRAGLKAVFGRSLVPDWRLENAQVVVSLDADFLGTEGDVAAQTRRWAWRRTEKLERGEMSRLYVVEGVHSLTGSNADHRIRVRTSQIEGVAFALALALEAEGIYLPPDVKQAAERLAAKDLKADAVKAMARDLATHRGEALVIPGRRQPPVVHALAAVLNEGLTGDRRTVYYFPDQRRAEDDAGDFENIRALAEALKGGKVDTLLVLGSNPVYTAPGDLGFAEAFAKAKTRIVLADTLDETAKAAQWVIPRAHFLEAWGDVIATDGTVSIQQPLVEPIHGARSEIEVLARILGDSITDGYGLVRDHWKRQVGAIDFHRHWRRWLHDGHWRPAGVGYHRTTGATLGLGGLAEGRPSPPAASKDALEVVFVPDATLYDGRFSNNVWLQEAPDPLTKLTWDNAALLSPKTAAALQIENEQRVKISVGGRTVDGVAWILPGVADDTVVLALGYGREFHSYLPYHDDGKIGFDVNPLRSSESPDLQSGGKVTASGGTYALACVQRYPRQDPGRGFKARALVREADLERFRKQPDFAKPGILKHGGEFPPGKMVVHPPAESLHPEFDYSKGVQWGMVFDLNACTGCNACLVACVAENNIPAVGKDQVRRGRELHWIRMDRYFTGSEDEPQVVHQPMPCQQCENAPCENVCPVAATSHSPDGLNDMAYNRCIGTRYCANNCPFKVRRFNFYNYTDDMPETVHMQRNPNVTVRFRGVMEKCTYCVQRINAGKRRAKRAKTEEARRQAIEAITPACAQSCPAGAIAFGDINDPKSEVSKWKKRDRDYGLLTELNVKPRTSYLAKIRNPNPALKS